jgi:hypothetical protein
MIFQEAPTALDWIVLAVIGWRVRQPERDAIRLDKLHQPLHTLRPPALVFWTILPIEPQGGERRAPLTAPLPPLGEAINEAIPGHCGRDPVHTQLAQGWQEDADGRYRRRGRTIVVGRLDLQATLPAPGDGADLNSRFRIHRDASDVVCHSGGVLDLGYLREDGVGFGAFFCGCLVATFFG